MAGLQLARNPWQAAWVGSRLLPRRVASVVGRRARGPLSVVASAAAGERERSRRALRAELSGARGRHAGRLLAAAAATGEALPSSVSAPARGGTAAYLAYAAGDVSRAQQALVGDRSPLAGVHRRWLAGERAVLQGNVLDTPRPRVTARAGSAGGVVHLVTNSLPEVQAGYTLRTRGIVGAQQAAGLDVHVCTPPGFPVAQGRLAAEPFVTVDGVPHHRTLRRGLPLGRPDELLEAYAASAAALAARVGASVLHAHSKHVNAQAALVAGARLGLPVVYEVRGFLEDTWRTRGGRADSDFYGWTRATETRCMREATAVVTLSQSMRDDIVARGIDPGAIHVVGNCVPDDHVDNPVDRDGVRERLAIGPDDVVVGTVSTLNDYEGIDVLLEAGALVDSERLVVLVVGDGPALDDLTTLAAAHARTSRTRFILTGRVPHELSRDHTAALDVFALPRRRTPVTRLVAPLKPVTAMGLGVPVVGSDLPPIRELLSDGRGVLVPAADATALATAVRELMDDPAGRKELGEDARAHVRTHLTWSAAARSYRQIYEAAS